MEYCAKYKKFVWIGLGVALLLLGIAFGKQEFEHDGRKGHGFLHHMQKHKNEVEHVFRFLDFTEEQEQQIHELFNKTHEQLSQMHINKEEMHKTLLGEFVKDDFDPAAIENIVSEEDVFAVRSLFAETVTGIHDILTAEQRKKLVEHITDHHNQTD